MKTVLKTISLLLIGIMIGWCVKEHTVQSNFQPNTPTIDSINNVINNNNNKIDSIEKVLRDSELDKIKLEDSLINLRSIKKTNILKIEELPLDSGILYLKIKLRENE